MNTTGHLDDLTQTNGFTLLIINILVNELCKIRYLICYTKIVTKKYVKEQSIQSIEGKDPGNDELRDKEQWTLWQE